ncbi:MAG TPA: type II secretion system protein GspI [Gammaproteobacteria bacterium]|nr:type II secretion system protein GspI [Gammaproteobacteria bacterium]
MFWAALMSSGFERIHMGLRVVFAPPIGLVGLANRLRSSRPGSGFRSLSASRSGRPHPPIAISHRCKTAARRAGFTLLEMLIAVLVIAVVGTSVAVALGESAGQTSRLEQRTLAHWVASNHIHEMRIAQRLNKAPLAEGKRATRKYMADQEWLIETEVKATDQELIRRVEIDIFLVTDEDRLGPLEHLVTLMGQH